MLDKHILLEKLLSQMGVQSEVLATAAEVTRTDSALAPGRNQSRYDSSREELGYLADGLNLRHADKIMGINQVSQTHLPECPDKIMLGTLVLLDNGRTQDNYFILPYGGGEYIETEEGEVSVITTSSPIYKQMDGKRIGDWFSLTIPGKTTHYQIIEIQ